jgi:hypothetical protein
MMAKKLLAIMGTFIASRLGIIVITGTQAAHARVALNYVV